ncbi:MAG: CPBP family intramembrane metalloprotease [Bacilli bacterium]|jgi:hypothetical protein|nr:CPBP family intramembrane metalloprotease [Bacilli bacterium]
MSETSTVNYDIERVKEPKVTYPRISGSRNFFIFILGFLGLDILSIIFGNLSVFFVKQQGVIPLLVYQSSVDYLSMVNGLRYMAAFALLFGLTYPLLPSFKKAFRQKRTWIRGISYGLLAMIASTAYSIFINIVYKGGVTDNANQNAVVNVILSHPITSFIWIPFLGPIVEELTYRVGLFDGVRKINKFFAYLVVMLVFGFIHFDFTTTDLTNELLNLPSYFIAGIMFCYAYDHDGAPSSIVAHVLNNLFSYAAILITAYL